MEMTPKTISHINQFLAWYNQTGHWYSKAPVRNGKIRRRYPVPQEIIKYWLELRKAKFSYKHIAAQSGVSATTVFKYIGDKN